MQKIPITEARNKFYKIDKNTVTVYALAAGIRKEGDKKDIYKVAKKLLDAGLLNLKGD